LFFTGGVYLSCEKNKELMLKYIEGSLNEAEMLKLSEHIKKCQTCGEEFAAYCQISDEIQNLEPFKVEKGTFSDDFESDVMRKISGIEFKTEKVLTIIIGVISLCIALLMFIEVWQSDVFSDKDFVTDIIKNSKSFIDKVIFCINFLIRSVLKFISEFLILMKPFSLSVITSVLLGKIIFIYLHRGGKNV